MFKQRILDLKKFLKDNKISFYLLPNSDEFFNEYLPESEKRIEFLTGFTGSNAFIIFTENKSYFFTDSRYILQSQNQLDLSEFEIINMAEISPLIWLKNNIKDKKIALDKKIFSIDFVEKLQKISNNIKFTDDLISSLWQERPPKPNSEIFILDDKITGKNSLEKRHNIIQNLNSDALLLTRPENICYLLNIRAFDIKFSPFLLAYAILHKNGEVDLFCDEKRLNNKKLAKVNIKNTDDILENLQKINSISLVKKDTNFAIFQQIKNQNLKINFVEDEIEKMRAVKNEVEIRGMKKSHEIDGIAVTKFLQWLDKEIANNEKVDEILVAKKLLEFRKENPAFVEESFAAISGFGSNGAIIHYQANEKTNKSFEKKSLYLIDSGGQYLGEDFCGTTDITRTVAIANPTKEMVADFTRVLKGHIAIARAKFPKGTSGAQLDVLARFHLWQDGKDYGHGTGHGVGSFLSVHEGPCAISKNSHQPLIEGMILSNEPGYYKTGEYGIRIENLVLVKKFNEDFLCFETITKAPIDEKLIDFKMLTYPERKWLEKYQSQFS